jgi:hypothetical protein
VAQYVLRADPNSINASRVQALIDDINSRSGSQQFLNIPTQPGGTLYVTDNPSSPILSAANRAQIDSYGPTLRGYSQAVDGRPAEYVNFDDEKPPINILVHEIGHLRWPGLGTDAAGHDPVFYRLLNDALDALGIPVDPIADVGGIDISNVRSPVPAGASPLDYSTRRQRSDAGSDQDSADVASAGSSGNEWSVALNSDNTITEGRFVQGETDTLRYDASGTLIFRAVSRADGTRGNETFDADGDLTSASGTNASGSTWSENLNGDNSTFTFNGQNFSGTQLASGAGLTLGSTIGGILGGNSLAGRIAGATVLGTLGESVGSILSNSGLGTALLGNGSLNASLFDSAVSSTVADFGGDLGVNAVGNIAGGLSSLLFGEAAHALGLNGFAAGAFTTIGTSITSQLATNLGAMTLNAAGISTTLVANFSAGAFIGNISGAIGGYFGSYLANEIVPATGIASSIGGRIGGAIGGFLASEIPVVGTFFGSLVGSVLGTLVGGLFDPHIVPWSSEMVGAVNGVLGINYWNWNGGGSPSEFTSLSNMVASNANQVLALTRRDPNIMNITGLTSLNELVFNQLGSTLTAIYPDGNSTNFYVDGMPQWFALQALYNTSEIATYELVQHAVLVGSDPIVTGALAAARVQDTTTPAIYADLRVAQDYERYRANAEIINTAMAANPQSDFTAGWNLTLLRAQALGLDRIVSHAGWTAGLTDSNETISDAAGNIVQQLTFNADGSVTSSTSMQVFDFNFVDAVLSYGSDGRTTLTGPDGMVHDITGVARMAFNDGYINEADGSPLVDDLYYDRVGARTFPRRRLQTSAQRRRLRRKAKQPAVAHRPYSRRVRLCAVKSACG